MGVRASEGRAAEVVDDRRGVLGELAGKSLDGPLGHPALFRSPLGRLRDTFFIFTQDIGRHFVHPHGMSGDVFFVPGVFLQPRIDDGQLQSGVGIRKHRDPLVGVHRGGVVEVGTDVDLLDAGSCPEL